MNNQHTEENSGNAWWVYVLILIIGLAVGYTAGYDRSSKKVVTTNPTPSPVVATSTSATTSSMITVVDQNAGLSVDLQKVVLKNIGWVAIHEDEGGMQGRILGAQLFDVGESTGTVSLLRNTEAGKTYYAVIYEDNGDRTFSKESDLPVMENGKAAVTVFHTIEKGLPIRNESSE